MRSTDDKQEVYDEIRMVLRLPKEPLGPGKKEHKETLVQAASRIGITLPQRLNKHQLGAQIAAAAGLPWGGSCRSTGQTITTKGLQRVLDALRGQRRSRGLRAGRPSRRGGGTGFGRPYIHRTGGIDRDAAAQIARLNPDALDRATRAHQDLLAAVAVILDARGIKQLSPRNGEPQYDLGWVAGHARVVLEAKSTTERNRVHQERLGVGQVLEYLDCLKQRGRQPVTGVLAVSNPPRRETLCLCEFLGIVVVWPPRLGERLRPVRGRKLRRTTSAGVPSRCSCLRCVPTVATRSPPKPRSPAALEHLSQGASAGTCSHVVGGGATTSQRKKRFRRVSVFVGGRLPG